MKKFMVLYMADPAAFETMMKNSTPEMQKKGMEAWMHWMTTHKESMVDGGAPLGKTKRVDANGAKDAKNGIGGYSVVPGQFARRRRKAVRQGPSPSSNDAWRMGGSRRDHADAGNVRLITAIWRLLESSNSAAAAFSRRLRVPRRLSRARSPARRPMRASDSRRARGRPAPSAPQPSAAAVVHSTPASGPCSLALLRCGPHRQRPRPRHGSRSWRARRGLAWAGRP